MAHGSIIWEEYYFPKGYLIEEDEDTEYGGGFWFLLMPFEADSGERYYLVEELVKGYQIYGRAHIVHELEPAIDKVERKFSSDQIFAVHYWFLDNEGNVYRKERYQISG